MKEGSGFRVQDFGLGFRGLGLGLRVQDHRNSGFQLSPFQ